MKYYVIKPYHISTTITHISSSGIVKEQTTNQIRDKKKDHIAYSWQNRKTGDWQIYTRPYDSPNCAAKLYDKFYNTPQPTRAACDAHMYYIHLKDGWEDPACQTFRDLVLDSIMGTELMSDFRRRKRQGMPISKEPPAGWHDFLQQLDLTTPKRMLTFDRFINSEADITPRPAWPHIRRMYFKLCDGLHIDPRAAGFEESIL